MKEKFVSRWFRAKVAEVTHKRLFGVQTVDNDDEVDYASYANSLVEIYSELDALGYDVVDVLPIDRGHRIYEKRRLKDVVSYVRGAIVIGKLRE